ncbi:unnamed protein product [Amoebophrya sp. A120]|nr:unnamed protein product [Amoebophrya sp. A120]|eukprot:GSA120T00024005001.1
MSNHGGAVWEYNPVWAPDVDPDALRRAFEFVGPGECLNQAGESLTTRKELYHYAKTASYKDCIQATLDEEWATGFAYNKVRQMCRVYGWVYKKITVPPWTAFSMDSASAIELADKNPSIDCWRKRGAVTCGYPLGSNLDPSRPCWEGSRIAAGARCTVKCQSGYLPWPKITTCRKEGYLERAGCWTIANNKLQIDVDQNSMFVQEQQAIPEQYQLDTRGNPDSWWYSFMDPNWTTELRDMDVLLARMRLKYKVSEFDPAINVPAADAYDREIMLQSRRIGVHEPLIVRDSIMTQLDLPKQAVRITGIEWVRNSELRRELQEITDGEDGAIAEDAHDGVRDSPIDEQLSRASELEVLHEKPTGRALIEEPKMVASFVEQEPTSQPLRSGEVTTSRRNREGASRHSAAEQHGKSTKGKRTTSAHTTEPEAASSASSARRGGVAHLDASLHMQKLGSPRSDGVVSLGRGYEQSASSSSSSWQVGRRKLDGVEVDGHKSFARGPRASASSFSQTSSKNAATSSSSSSGKNSRQNPWKDFSYPDKSRTYYTSTAKKKKEKHDVRTSPARKRRNSDPVRERLRKLVQRRARRRLEEPENYASEPKAGSKESSASNNKHVGKVEQSSKQERETGGRQRVRVPPDRELRSGKVGTKTGNEELVLPEVRNTIPNSARQPFSPREQVKKTSKHSKPLPMKNDASHEDIELMRQLLESKESHDQKDEGARERLQIAREQDEFERLNREIAESRRLHEIEEPDTPSLSRGHGLARGCNEQDITLSALSGGKCASEETEQAFSRSLLVENGVEFLLEDFYVEILPPSNLQSNQTRLREFQTALQTRLTNGLPRVTNTILENVLHRRKTLKSTTLSLEEFYGQNSQHIPMRIYYQLEGKSPGSQSDHPHHTEDHFTDDSLLKADYSHAADDLSISFPKPFMQEFCQEKLSFNGYRGCQSFTLGGSQCQSWDRQWPRAHTFSPVYDPLGDPFNSNPSRKSANLYSIMLRNNFCANPDGREPGSSSKVLYTSEAIWCYTNDQNGPEWDYCEPKTRNPPIRCHKSDPFFLMVGGRRFTGYMHNSLSYLAPSQYETTVLMRNGIVPFRVGEATLNLTLWKDNYASENLNRSCASWDSDYNGSFDIFCVDTVSDLQRNEDVKALSYEIRNATDENKRIRSRIYIRPHCTDRLFHPTKNHLPWMSGVRYTFHFRFESDPVDLPTNVTDNRRFGLSEHLTGQCREECMKLGYFKCGAFVTKQWQDGLNFTDPEQGLYNCYIFHPEDLTKGLVSIGAGTDNKNDVTTWMTKNETVYRSARWNYTEAPPIHQKPATDDGATFFESMKIVLVGLGFVLAAAVIYWCVKRYILKNMELRRRAAEGKLGLKDGLGLGGAGTAGSNVPTLSVMAPVMRRSNDPRTEPVRLPDHVIHMDADEHQREKEARRAGQKESRIGKKWRPKSGPGSDVPFGTNPDLWHAGFQGRESQFHPSTGSVGEAVSPAKAHYERKVSPQKRTAWLDETAPDMMIGAGRGVEDAEKLRHYKEHRIKSTTKLMQHCMDDDNFVGEQQQHQQQHQHQPIRVEDMSPSRANNVAGVNRIGLAAAANPGGIVFDSNVLAHAGHHDPRMLASPARITNPNAIPDSTGQLQLQPRQTGVAASAAAPRLSPVLNNNPAPVGQARTRAGQTPTAAAGSWYTSVGGGDQTGVAYPHQQGAFSAHNRNSNAANAPSSVSPVRRASLNAPGYDINNVRISELAPSMGATRAARSASAESRYLAAPGDFNVANGSMRNAARDSRYAMQRDAMFGSDFLGRSQDD